MTLRNLLRTNWLKRESDPAFLRRAKIILDNLEILGNERVLDLGCGRGFYLRFLSSRWPGLKLYGVDLNQKYLKIAKKSLKNNHVHLVKADATKLSLSDNFFDRIIASEILEHIKDDQKALSEIYRVLKPGGITLITVPNKNYPFLWDPLNWLLERIFHTHVPANIWWLAGIWADHIRLYDKRELISKLKKAGFKIEETWEATHYCLPFAHFLLYGIGKNLVERGFLRSFNRFIDQPRQSSLNKVFLWPMRKIDELNKRNVNLKSSVNLIVRVRKT